MQTATAFGSVQTALSFFVTAYRQIAEWRAVIDRLAGFEAAIAVGRALVDAPDAIKREQREGLRGVEASALDVHLPGGGPPDLGRQGFQSEQRGARAGQRPLPAPASRRCFARSPEHGRSERA